MNKRLNLPLLAIVGEGLFSRLSFGFISFALPLYARHLGMGLTEIGVLLSLNSAAAIALKPVLGWVGDRFGMKRTLLVAIGLRSAVSLLLGFVSAPWELFAIRSAHGLSMSLRDPSANTLIAEHGGERSVASAFAWYQTAKTVAASASRALAGILLALTAANYPLIFGVAFAVSVVPAIVVALFVKEEARGSAPRSTVAESATATEAVKPRVLPYVGLGMLIAGTAEMLSGLFPVLATEYAGLSDAQAGMIYGISTVVTVLAGPIFGWLSDHVSRTLVLFVRSFANTVSSIMYVLAPNFLGVGLARTVDDMGKAAFRPAWGALMAQIAGCDRKSRARTMSWLTMGEDAGGVAAPILAGFLWSTWGIMALMGVRVVLAVVTEGFAIAITHPGKRRTPKAGFAAVLTEKARP